MKLGLFIEWRIPWKVWNAKICLLQAPKMEAKQAKDVTGSILEEIVQEHGQRVYVFCGTIYIATLYIVWYNFTSWVHYAFDLNDSCFFPCETVPELLVFWLAHYYNLFFILYDDAFEGCKKKNKMVCGFLQFGKEFELQAWRQMKYKQICRTGLVHSMIL